MNYSKLTQMLIGMLATALIVGCSGRGAAGVPEMIEPYEQAMAKFPGSEVGIDAGVARFKETYADLTDPRLADRIRETYADALFFNDTLHTFSRVEELADYMEKTGAGLHESIVEVHQVIADGPDVYLRWTMEFKTRAVGRDIHSRSIGMTHLRFDDDGRVVLHQDFWDSGHALYAHLPFVGFAVRRARSSM